MCRLQEDGEVHTDMHGTGLQGRTDGYSVFCVREPQSEVLMMTDDAKVCPKCGSEMTHSYLSANNPHSNTIGNYWFCQCGHEEKVKP